MGHQDCGWSSGSLSIVSSEVSSYYVIHCKTLKRGLRDVNIQTHKRFSFKSLNSPFFLLDLLNATELSSPQQQFHFHIHSRSCQSLVLGSCYAFYSKSVINTWQEIMRTKRWEVGGGQCSSHCWSHCTASRNILIATINQSRNDLQLPQ